MLELIFLQMAQTYLPPGYVKACATGEATHCQVASISKRDLELLNAQINWMIEAKPDDPKQKFDVWEVFPDKGDCSSYVMSKREALIAFGVDLKRLTIVIGEHKREGQWRSHMTLHVAMPDGAVVVMDNAVKDGGLYAPGLHPLGFEWREAARSNPGGLLWTRPSS
jgi:predicted transglutaminase-like cysteine proteinase